MSKVYKMAFTSKKSILEKMIFMIIFEHFYDLFGTSHHPYK